MADSWIYSSETDDDYDLSLSTYLSSDASEEIHILVRSVIRNGSVAILLQITLTLWLVIFVGLIFCGLGSLGDFVGLYFCGTPTLITWLYS